MRTSSGSEQTVAVSLFSRLARGSREGWRFKVRAKFKVRPRHLSPPSPLLLRLGYEVREYTRRGHGSPIQTRSSNASQPAPKSYKTDTKITSRQVSASLLCMVSMDKKHGFLQNEMYSSTLLPRLQSLSEEGSSPCARSHRAVTAAKLCQE